MAKQNINVGTAANDKKGDSLRAAFQKVNANFTELYTELGLVVDANLNLGAFEFAGSTISTTDSSAIVIDQATTITSNLSVGGDLLPQTALGGDLGSSTLPWRSLYVSNNTIYIGGTAVGIDAAGNLTTGGTVVGSTPAWANITGKPTIPTGFDRLTSSGDEVILIGGANPFTLFPAITGGDQLQIQGSEVSTVSGSLALTSQDNLNIIANGSGAAPGGSKNWTFGDNGSLTLPGDIRSEGNINIEINLGDSTLHRWQFGEDGALTLPPGGTILNSSGQPYVYGITSINSSVAIGVYNDASGDYQYGTLSYDYAVNGITSGGFSIEYSRPLVGGNVDIHVGNTIVNGDLTLSGDIKSDGNINIDINLADSTLRRWQFGEDGLLTFPDGTSQTTAYTGGSGTGDITFSTRTIAASTAGEIRVQSANGVSLGPLTTQSDIRLTFDGLGLTVGGSNTLQGLNYRLFTDAGTPKDLLYTYRTGNLSEFLIQAGGTVGGILKLSADGSNGYVNIIANGTTWAFGTTGRTTFPNGVVPAHSYGAAGDKEGMVVFDDTYIYYCTADYVNNSTDIWKRTAHGAGTW
jgi:hypothetical protein